MQFQRIWLGTVQLGLPYGLSKRRLSAKECYRLMDAAWERGIRRFDAARIYGNAEQRIGEWTAATGAEPLLASKLPDLGDVPDGDVRAAGEDALERSRRLMRRDRIDLYLCHRAADIERPVVRAFLEGAAAEGRIGAYGVSGYSPEDADNALAACPGIAQVQLPASVVDRRLARTGVADRLRAAGVVVQLRSLYLQGAVLLRPDQLPAHLKSIGPIVEGLHRLARRHRLSAAALAVAYALDRNPGCDAVIGFRSVAQIAALERIPDDLAGLRSAFDALDELAADFPVETVDPRLWPDG